MHICHLNLSKYFNAPEKQMEVLIENLGKNYRPYKQTLFYLKKRENGFKNNPKVSSEMRMMFHKLKMNLYERLYYLVERGELQIVELPLIPYLVFRDEVFLEQFKMCDIIHTHDKDATFFAYLLRKKLKIPYIITHHKAYAPNRFLKRAFIRSSKVITVSNYVKEALLKNSPEYSDKVDVIHNMPTINPEKVDKGESNFIRSPYTHTIIVGMVGKLLDSKGFELVIELAKRYIKIDPHIQFVLVGDGKRDAILREKSKNLFNFKMTGFVVNIDEYMEMFDIFLLPSRDEAFGSTLLDAMELGKPVIASDVGGVREIVTDEVNGLLFKSGDLDSLQNQLSRLVSDKILVEKLKQDKMYWLDNIHYGKDSLYFKLSRKSKERAVYFSQDKITNMYEKVYEEVTR
jgi:glycosyltransferase involved in cell wall biosynthesis